MKTVIFTISILLVQICFAQQLFTDKIAQQKMEKMYLNKKVIFSNQMPDFFNHVDNIQDNSTKEATKFLIAYAPLSDITNLDFDFFEAQAKYALQTKQKFTWGKTIPEEIFIHFVLPYRVNNEDPDSSRQVFQKELENRIKNMSLYDAALEVNHWCHEKANYKASDGRTSGPLSTVRTGHGRCGEESTFTVAAMRSVGIPARQVYTPRWAHTDDNHAWVEVWVDGKWYFLGACEPSPELNMGWFEIPATRTIMVHTNTFGQYFGPEKTLVKKQMYSQLNLLSNYAPCKDAKVKVLDSDNKPVERANVDFGVYNYSEFYPFAQLKTDNNGFCSVETGYGDLLIWAYSNNNFAYSTLNAFDEDTLILKLNNKPLNLDTIINMTIIPPTAGKHVDPQSDKVLLNDKRLEYEDSIRTAYEMNFPDSTSLCAKFAGDKYANEITKFILLSRGNHSEIIRFYTNAKKDNKDSQAIIILSEIAEKDLRDVPCEILSDHLYNIDKYKSKDGTSQEIINKYVVNPRISNELLRPWRSELRKYFSETEIDNFRNSPDKLCKWIETNVTVDDEMNYYRTPIFPDKALIAKRVDKHSRNILFVACCRSFGIPARIETATNTAQYYNNEWINAFPEKAEPQKEKGFLILDNKTKIDPKYYTHYTIAILKDGKFVSLDYEFDETLYNFPCTLSLDPGTYRLMTGDRQSDGSVHVRWSFFEINPKVYTSKSIIFNEKDIEIKEYFTLKSKKIAFQNLKTGKTEKLNKLKQKTATIIAYIDPQSEPGRHFLSELQDCKTQLSDYKNKILLVQPNSINGNYLSNKYELPQNAYCLQDSKNTLGNELKENLPEATELPIIILVKPDNSVIFTSYGYQINTVQMLLRLINRIEK